MGDVFLYSTTLPCHYATWFLLLLTSPWHRCAFCTSFWRFHYFLYSVTMFYLPFSLGVVIEIFHRLFSWSLFRFLCLPFCVVRFLFTFLNYFLFAFICYLFYISFLYLLILLFVFVFTVTHYLLILLSVLVFFIINPVFYSHRITLPSLFIFYVSLFFICPFSSPRWRLLLLLLLAKAILSALTISY